MFKPTKRLLSAATVIATASAPSAAVAVRRRARPIGS
jgi:hypothetical protein